MIVQEFVNGLNEISPSRENLIKEGFEGKFIDFILSGYNLPVKNFNAPVSDESLISSLGSKYDLTCIRFGDYSFEQHVVAYNGNKIFCTSSGTYLAINLLNGEILEFDKDNDSLIQPCTSNEASFLKSLLFILQLKSLKLQGQTLGNWQEVVAAIFTNALEASGGNRYKEFLRPFFEE